MKRQIVLIICMGVVSMACQKDIASENSQSGSQDNGPTTPGQDIQKFVMGADSSYVNHILDHGRNYQDSGSVENPHKIFA